MHVSEYAALSKSVCEWLIKPVIIHTMEGPIWCVMILCPLSFSDSVFAELVTGGGVYIVHNPDSLAAHLDIPLKQKVNTSEKVHSFRYVRFSPFVSIWCTLLR